MRQLWGMGGPAVVLALTCGSCSSGGNGNGGAQTCPSGYDGGGVLGGTESESSSGQCGNLLNGTAQNGSTCQQSSDCAPTCCACPGGGRSAQVALCRQGQCVVGADVCCIWIAENEGTDGGGA